MACADRSEERETPKAAAVWKCVLLIRGLSWPWIVRWVRASMGHKDHWEVVAELVASEFGGQPRTIALHGWLKWAALFFPSLRGHLARQLLNQLPLPATGVRPEVSVVAHSFGTVVLAEALQIEPSMRVDRVVLFNSPLSTTFDWSALIREGRLQDYRNVVGKKDCVIRLTYLWEAVKRCVWASDGGLGGAGSKGFSCCGRSLWESCETHNRHFGKYGHLTGINRVGLPRWMYFLGLQPSLAGLESLGDASDATFRGGEPVEHELVGALADILRKAPRAVLVEGPKGSGKSWTTLLALRAYYTDKAEDRFPVYYLDSGRLRAADEKSVVKQSIAMLPPVALLCIDDLHRQIGDAVEVALAALQACRARLVLVSRYSSSDAYERLRQAFNGGEETSQRLFPISKPLERRNWLEAFTKRVLSVAGKPTQAEVVSGFAELYGDDLTALVDAIGEWQPPVPITKELADVRLRRRLESDPDFDVPEGRDKGLGAFLSAAVFWQFEEEITGQYLTDVLGIPIDVANLLANRGVLNRRGRPGARAYALDDHELRARRYARVGDAPDFVSYLRSRFRDAGFVSLSEGTLTANVLLLELCSLQAGSQAERLRRMNQIVLYGGYRADYIAATEIFRANLDLLNSVTRVEVLAQGGSARRRDGALDEAAEWLAAAKRIVEGLPEGPGIGRILYEQAYLVYYRNDFFTADDLFKESAAQTAEPVGRERSLAKAAEAYFQGIVKEDPFSQNLHENRGPNPLDEVALRSVRAQLEDHLSNFDQFAADPQLAMSRRADAARWVSNCLVHLSDVCIEEADFDAAEEYLRREERQISAAKHEGIRPVLRYLQGRLTLVTNPGGSAVDLLEEALKGYRRMERREGLGDVLITIGDALAAKQRSVARQYYMEASQLGPAMRNGRAAAAAIRRLSKFR